MNLITFQYKLIAFILSIIVMFSVGYSVAYLHQKNKYELQITKEHNESLKSIAEAAQNVIVTERNNTAIISKLNEEVAAKQAKINVLNSSLDKLRDERGRLSVKSDVCQDSTGTPSGASDIAEEPSSKLSPEFSQFLIERENEVNNLRLYAETCNSYAAKIIEQRERIIKENK